MPRTSPLKTRVYWASSKRFEAGASGKSVHVDPPSRLYQSSDASGVVTASDAVTSTCSNPDELKSSECRLTEGGFLSSTNRPFCAKSASPRPLAESGKWTGILTSAESPSFAFEGRAIVSVPNVSAPPGITNVAGSGGGLVEKLGANSVGVTVSASPAVTDGLPGIIVYTSKRFIGTE